MYQSHIARILARMCRSDIDPRHVEAWMRVENPTLDGLSADQFDAEVDAGVACIDEAGREASEALAASFAL